MSYLDLILRFWQLDKQHCFSPEETRLYFYLLDVANDHKPSWPDSFERADPKTAADNRMAVNTMKKWRNRLEEVGLINVEPGGKGQGNRVRYQVRYQFLTPKEVIRCQISRQNLTPNAVENKPLVSGKVSKFDTYSLYTRIKTFFYIAIDADKVSNFDTYVRSKKKESPPPSDAPPETEDWPSKVKTDRVFGETVHKNLKFSADRMHELIDEFAAEQAAVGEAHPSFKEFKKHCYNWLRIQSEKAQKNGKQNQRIQAAQPTPPQTGKPFGAWGGNRFGRRTPDESSAA